MPLKCTRLIKQKTGLSLKEFCEQHLGTEYKTFQMRMRKKKLYPAEVAYICWYLGVQCEDAFEGVPYEGLVMFQGKGDVVDKAKALWSQADGNERIRLMSLLGIDLSFITPEPPKPLPGPIKATKTKRQPEHNVQPAKPDKFSFVQDIDRDAPVESEEDATSNTSGAPEDNSQVKDFFIETY